MIEDPAFLCPKKPYTKREAQTVINERTKGRIAHRHGRPKHLRKYHCPDCNAWHLTHKGISKRQSRKP
jgi:hypothetical protein